MRKAILAALLGILLGNALYAQYDLSLWSRRIEGKGYLIPWYMYTGKGICLDLRYNFDAEGSLGAFVGKSFGDEKLLLVPEFGLITGKYRAVSPEFLVIASTKRFQVFAQNQVALGMRGGEMINHDFVYNWVDWVFNVKEWLALGAGEQVFKEFSPGSRTRVDLGPSAKFSIDKMYIRLWPMVSLGPAARGHKAFLMGIGYVF